MSGDGRPLVAVLDYGIGNLRSAQKALEHVGADARLTADTSVIEAAAGVVLPGVGSFGRCMEALRSSKLDKPALDAIAAGVPFMGICVGMQMLYEGSDETPEVHGLGVLAGRIRLLPDGVKRPQMQWNTLDRVGDPTMLRGLDEPVWVYFVHSYAAETSDVVAATCDYGAPLVACVERDRLWATQFHPEKSGAAGLAILRNFVASL
ncbi:MAG: imidazole glycerol-phosphate synthase subunit HisH [Actinomycetota bacterium]|nr:imidazole glycerol-phosphate synthase subunit HisH [Actinomycetota bacterium]